MMSIENQSEQLPSSSESDGEEGAAETKKQLTRWHRILGKEQELALTSVAIDVYPEIDLMSDPPKADLLLLRNKHRVWTEEQRARLPDGIRDSSASRILIEFKYTESANIKAIRQALWYDYVFMETRLRDNPELEGKPEDELATFLLSSKSPTEKTLATLGFYPAEQKGIYECDDPIKGRVTILSLNDLPREPHNALVKCFASKPEEQRAAFDMLRDTELTINSPELLWLLQGLEVTLVEKGGLEMQPTITGEITADYLMEVGKTMYDRYLPSLPIETLLTYVPAERIVSHLKPSELWKLPTIHKTAVEREQRAEKRGEKMGENRGQQRTLLRLIRRKFEDVPNDIVKLIEQTHDSDLLDSWSDRIFDADTLSDIQFNSI